MTAEPCAHLFAGGYCQKCGKHFEDIIAALRAEKRKLPEPEFVPLPEWTANMRCMNCWRKAPTAFLTDNFGPVCRPCYDEMLTAFEVK